MITAGQLAILIEAHDSASAVLRTVGGAVNNVRGATDQARASGSALSQTWAVMAGVLGAGIFTRVAGEIRGAVSGVVSFSAVLQNAEIAFRVFLGGAQAARETMADLRAFTINTPFEFPQVLKAAQNLLAYGTTAADVIPTLTMLGNLAQGNAEKLGSLQLAYGQVMAATKLTGAELRQFTEAGIPLLSVLAEHFKTTAGAVKTMIEEGKVGFGDVRTVLAGLVNEGGKFHNLMGEASKSWNGAFAAISDSANLAMSDVFAPLFTLMTSSAVSIAAFLQSVDFRLFAVEAGRAFQNVTEWVVYFAEKAWLVVTVLYNLADLVYQNSDLLQAMAVVFAVLVAPAIWGAFTAMLAFIAPIIGVGLALGALIAVVYYIISSFGGLESAGGIIMDVFAKLADVIASIAGPALDYLGKAFDTVTAFLMRRFITIAQGIAILGHAVGADISGLVGFINSLEAGTGFEGLKAGFSSVVDFVGGRIDLLKENVAQGASIIASLWDEVTARLTRPITLGGARVGMGERPEGSGPPNPNVSFTGAAPELLAEAGAADKAAAAKKGDAAATKELTEDTRALEDALRLLQQRAEALGDALRNALSTGSGSSLDRVRQGLADFAKAEWIADLEARIDVVSAQIHKAMAEGLDLQPIIDAALPLFDAYTAAVAEVTDAFAEQQEQMRNYEETLARNAASLDKQLTDLAARRREREEEDAKRIMELAQQTYDFKLSLEIAAGNRDRARKMLGYFEDRLDAVLNNPTDDYSAQRLAEFVAAHPEFRARLSMPDPRDALSGATADILDQIREMLALMALNSSVPLQGFDTGGLVGGPIGRAQLAVVHGGEYVSPAGASRNVSVVVNNYGTIGVDGLGQMIDEHIRDGERQGKYRAGL